MNVSAGLAAGALTFGGALALRVAARTARRSAVARRLRPRVTTPRTTAGRRAWPVPPPVVRRRLAEAALPLDEEALWAGWLVTLGVAGPVGWVAGGPGLATVAVALVVAAPAVALVAAAGRADRLVEAALPEAMEAMARSLRSGASLRQAVEETATSIPGLLGADLDSIATEVARGEVLADALDHWGRRRPLPGVRLAVSALALGAETGGAHARAIDGVAATLRSRLAVVGEMRALSSQARLSGLVITLAPLGFSALAAATDERSAGFLLRTPLGLACLSAGLALDGVAALWMMRLSRIEW